MPNYKSKYSIDDVAYVMHDNEIRRVTITKVFISETKYGIEREYDVECSMGSELERDSVPMFHQDELHSTLPEMYQAIAGNYLTTYEPWSIPTYNNIPCQEYAP